MRKLLSIAAIAACALAGSAMAQALPAAPPPLPQWVAPAPGQPVESQPRENARATPAFPGQTRGPYEPTHVAYEVQTYAQDLERPWGLAFLPDGRLLVTERQGRLRIIAKDGTVSPPVAGLPSVDGRVGGGLLDVAVDPDFTTNHLIYWIYAEPRGDGSGASVARARLVTDGPAHVERVQIIFRMMPTVDSVRSFGARLAFGRGKTLFVTLGDRDFDPFRPLVQRLDTDIGKVVRINRDGTIPKDNPYLHVKGARPELWAVGVRNALGAAVDPATGELWENENGPRGGDELNLIRGGRNYGWPVITYGEEYSGQPVGAGITEQAGMEQPVYYWDPVIAPSGLAFYEGDLFPAWKGSLFLGSLRQKHLVRLSIKDGKVTGEERLLTEVGERIRAVIPGPDGALYILTEPDRGRVLRVVPNARP